ncbi:pistil-specific extensin-like protein [Nylanderia fulva]|uniref:pistil-specific extensin-like protein n=1 Tax=Nylanderia fulva TaxID=613905 RepID=UPI0010FB3F40|nr:pistil-specific extensin-like protein [Nylanderia fulva]
MSERPRRPTRVVSSGQCPLSKLSGLCPSGNHAWPPPPTQPCLGNVRAAWVRPTPGTLRREPALYQHPEVPLCPRELLHEWAPRTDRYSPLRAKPLGKPSGQGPSADHARHTHPSPAAPAAKTPPQTPGGLPQEKPRKKPPQDRDKTPDGESRLPGRRAEPHSMVRRKAPKRRAVPSPNGAMPPGV